MRIPIVASLLESVVHGVTIVSHFASMRGRKAVLASPALLVVQASANQPIIQMRFVQPPFLVVPIRPFDSLAFDCFDFLHDSTGPVMPELICVYRVQKNLPFFVPGTIPENPHEHSSGFLPKMNQGVSGTRTGKKGTTYPVDMVP
uniref:hypothetical protein n=1 Tax=Pseudodesulfovibrio profundus TaxID=57320 RepID=UPI001E3D4F96|nr:hypothetical protein [Pseudodesulfovibrio profundus]